MVLYPLLQVEAIQVLGASGNDQALTLIGEIYRSSNDLQVKRAALQASMVADESALVLEILRNESDPSLQLEAIQMLGVMDETEQLHQLYTSFTDVEVRRAVLQALMIADDGDGLRALIDSEQDPELRRAAIRNLALTGELDSVEALDELYDSARSIDEKRAVIEALFVIGDDGEALALKIARQETDPQLQRQAIEALGVMDAPEALLQLYPQLSDRATRQMVIQGLMIADATDELIGLLEGETDTGLRTELIRHIAIGDEDDAAKYLVASYGDAEVAEQDAILEAMLIMDHAEGLIELLREEPDRTRKQRILQTLMAVDSDEATEYVLKALEASQ